MLVFQALQVTTSTHAENAHWAASKEPWEWKQKLESGFTLLKAVSYIWESAKYQRRTDPSSASIYRLRLSAEQTSTAQGEESILGW